MIKIFVFLFLTFSLTLFSLKFYSFSLPLSDHSGSYTDSEVEELFKMHKLCRQVSIESPGSILKDCVFSFVVPVPDTPEFGARVKVVCAGACYRRPRNSSVSSVSSIASDLSALREEILATQHAPPLGSSPSQTSFASPAHHGMRDGALFPGFEVAGVIEELGTGVTSNKNDGFYVGQRVVLYPFDDAPDGYAEYIVVPELKYLIPVPDNMPLSVAAMLPTGALLAMNTVFEAHDIVMNLLRTRELAHAESPTSDAPQPVRILIVGTGGLALWAVRIAEHHFHKLETSNKVQITIASLRDEGFLLAKEIQK